MYICCSTAVISKNVRLCESDLEQCLFMSPSVPTLCHYMAWHAYSSVLSSLCKHQESKGRPLRFLVAPHQTWPKYSDLIALV